jgi:predicted ester cyclase
MTAPFHVNHRFVLAALVADSGGEGEQLREVAPVQRRVDDLYQAIPDARADVLDVVAEGDKIVLVDRFGGTHRGEFFGRPGTAIASSGWRSTSTPFVTAKSSEDATMTDALAIMQQLGLAPSLTKAAE